MELPPLRNLPNGVLCVRDRVFETIIKPLGALVGTLSKQTISNKTFNKTNSFNLGTVNADVGNVTTLNTEIGNITTLNTDTANITTLNTVTANITNLNVNAVFTNYTPVTSTYTILSTDSTVDCTSGTFTVTVFTAVGVAGRVLNIKNSGVGNITVDASGSETIDGELTQLIASGNNMPIQSNGADWIIL